MTDNRTLILDNIETNFEKNWSIKRRFKLSSFIGFTITDQTVKMHIPKDTIAKNMQDDSTAFEGWALVIKRWGNADKVVLSWDRHTPVINGHYQRFLFRVKNFLRDFGSWFSISQDSQIYLEELRIKDTGTYFLNSPETNRKESEPQRTESKYEIKFTSNKFWGKDLKNASDAEFLYRQLPVGVFEGDIKKDNSIFTGGKSAIDIWGINHDELLLFELKAEKNNKIGIISELYFYSCIMRCVHTGLLKHKNSGTYTDLDRIANTKKIKAYFLAPKLHPLIDLLVVDELNVALAPNIEFQYLQFEESSDNITLQNGFSLVSP